MCATRIGKNLLGESPIYFTVFSSFSFYSMTLLFFSWDIIAIVVKINKGNQPSIFVGSFRGCLTTHALTEIVACVLMKIVPLLARSVCISSIEAK